MHLIGVDIGFSERRRTSGIAVFRDGALIRTERLSVSERDAALREPRDVDVIAIDAPLLPPGTADTLPRYCERFFSLGLFQKRCKPGMSHIRGTGQRLREHGRQAAEQLLVAPSFVASSEPRQRVWLDAPIIEAFPNAFLGVALPDEDYAIATKTKRGGKFDWLYERWIQRGLFRTVADAAQLPAEIAARCEAETDHDIRARWCACSAQHSPPKAPPSPSDRKRMATSPFHARSCGRNGRAIRSARSRLTFVACKHDPSGTAPKAAGAA